MAVTTTPTPSQGPGTFTVATATLTDAEVLAKYPPEDATIGQVLIVPGAIPAPLGAIPVPTIYVAFTPDGKTLAWAKLPAVAAVVPANLP